MSHFGSWRSDTAGICSPTGGTNVYLAADGEPGPTAWAQASIATTCR
jgi:hypothetical protein